MEGKHNSAGTVLIILLAVIVLVGAFCVTTYNKLVTLREEVDQSYANIGTQLQRRSDLIPNLVSSVSAYMEHEQSIIDSVTQSREHLLNAGSIAEQADADQELSTALSSLLVLAEAYPELKANENFIQLQDELAGTENRIATARRDYNEVAGTYNAQIRRFPGVVFANLFGFDRVDYFQPSVAAEEVPHVVF